MSNASRRINAWISAIPVILTLAYATVFVVREGLADVQAIDAIREIALWETGQPPRPDRFRSVEQSLGTAIHLSPSNGDHWESLGSAWFARASAPNRTLEGSLQDFDRAANAYREAIRRTPVSGYAWGGLVMAKHRAGQVDAEMSEAIRSAARFGPHEAAVQSAILATVLPRWIDVDGESRRIAAETLQRGWRDHRRELFDVAATALNRGLWCDPALWPVDSELTAAMDRLCRSLPPAEAGTQEPPKGRSPSRTP